MSILLETESGWIVSHLKFFEKLQVLKSTEQSEDKCSVEHEPEELSNCSGDGNFKFFKLNPNLFEITEPFRESSRKRKNPSNGQVTLSETTCAVKQLAELILNHSEAKKIFKTESLEEGKGDKILENFNLHTGGSEISGRRNSTAVQTCQHFYDAVKDFHLPQFRGQNPDPEVSVLSEINGDKPDLNHKSKDASASHKFIFPPNCSFYCNDVSNIADILAKDGHKKFDLLVLDPPWQNKAIRRKKRKQGEAGYEMVDDEIIAELPVKELLEKDGIIVVWCTNAKSHQDALLKEFFPKWGVTHHKTMYWLKVTKSGAPICPFNVENTKQPYETIIIGRRSTSESVATSQMLRRDPTLIISVPSCINSHKPPLIEVLRRLFPCKKFERNCEIFARYLVPGFTSFGNEVIKLQHIGLYVHDSPL